MDTTAVKRIVEEHLHPLQHRLQVQEWRVDVLYEALEGETNARTNFIYPYRHAKIRIDPAQHDDEADVIRSLRHELAHLVLAPFGHAIKTAERILENDDTASRAFDEAKRFAVEECIVNLERMLDGKI